MRRHRPTPVALIMLCAITSIQLTGCTAIGFGVGALADMSSGKRTPDQLVTVATGTRITVWLRDGRQLHGRFVGSSDSLSEAVPPVPPKGVARSFAPPRAVLLLSTHHGIQQIPIENVNRVSVPVARGKVIGLITGFSADSLMIFLLLAALSQIDFS